MESALSIARATDCGGYAGAVGSVCRGRYGTNGNFRLFHLFHSSLLLADGFGDALGPQPREQVLKKLKASLSFLDFFSFLP
jgi:hypothetical protein